MLRQQGAHYSPFSLNTAIINFETFAIYFLIEEAELAGWEKHKGAFGNLQDEANEEFINYCFPFNNDKYVDELENMDREERFKEVVLDSLTDFRERFNGLPSLINKALLIGVVLGVVISVVMRSLF